MWRMLVVQRYISLLDTQLSTLLQPANGIYEQTTNHSSITI